MKFKNLLIGLYIKLYKMFNRVNNCVLFESFHGAAYSDNPKAISEKLHELDSSIKIKWLVNLNKCDINNIPSYIKVVNIKKGRTALKSYLTSKVYVTNFALPKLKKSKKQTFIQTWHGDKAFKKVLYDSGYRTEKDVVYESQEGYCDLMVAGSDYGVRQFRSAFRYTGDILNIGTPRNDKLIFINSNEIAMIKSTLGIEKDVKILLFAPTLRQKNSDTNTLQEIEDLNLSLILDALGKRDGGSYVCLLRAHPAMKGLYNNSVDNRILDVSKYPDMADLLLVSDVLITDYSSCAGDFALTGKHIYLFQPDRKEYVEGDRSFYFDIDDSPYFVAQTQDELLNIIKNTNDELAKKNCDDILRFYGNTETGKASEEVCKKIIDWIRKK